MRVFLFPFACLYGLIMQIRNKFFDWHILPSESFNIPVISVGNLSYGGTGKTPHIEYIVRLLRKKFNVATLSRGYGRRSKGFVLANEFSSYHEIGDEPLQYRQKFEDIDVAVDECRRRGIKLLYNLKHELNCILLDDAYQHRYVKPGLSILLTAIIMSKELSIMLWAYSWDSRSASAACLRQVISRIAAKKSCFPA